MSLCAGTCNTDVDMVGVGRAAQEGVLFKDAEAIERMEKVDTVVIDKTGTLTEGKPKLLRVVSVDGNPEPQILELAGSLESNSEHPLGQAIVEGAKERGAQIQAPESFQSVTGGGAIGRVASNDVVVGSLDFVARQGISGLEHLRMEASPYQERGNTVVGIVIGGKPSGLLVIADPIKSTSPDAVRQLHAMHVDRRQPTYRAYGSSGAGNRRDTAGNDASEQKR